jgi:hypothetical protein
MVLYKRENKQTTHFKTKEKPKKPGLTCSSKWADPGSNPTTDDVRECGPVPRSPARVARDPPPSPPLGVRSNSQPALPRASSLPPSQLAELVSRARKIRLSLPQFSDVGYPTHELGRFVVFSSKYNYTGIYMRCFFDRRAIDIPQNIIIIIYVHIYIFSSRRRSTTSCQLEVYLRYCCRTFTLLLDLSARVSSKKKSIKEKSSN